MKKLLIILFVLAMVGMVFADTVQVGTGTATTSNLPISGNWGYTYSQQIYTQAQIAKAGDITKLRFYYVSGTITNSKDWVVYMGHTTKTTFATTTDWVPLANLTQVFAGDVSSMAPLANNWMEITLTTPFAYNNTDNLIVAVDENTPGYASMSWGAFTSGTNTGIYYRNDSTNPDPAAPPTATGRVGLINRMQFVFPSTTAPLAPTLVSPANGGESFTNGKLSWTATSGGADTDSYDVYFGTSATPPLVSGGQAETFYAPSLTAGTTYYWNVVAHNSIGASPASPTWSFTAVSGVAIGDGTVTSLNLPLNPYWGYNYSQTLYLQSEINTSGQRIEKLYYHWNGLAAGTNTKDWAIYMGHTDKSAFAGTTDWVPFGNMIEVFSGEVILPATAGWIEITLNMPFVYNNTDNLVIAVNEFTPGDNGNNAKFFGTGTASNRGLRLQTDSSAYDPAAPGSGTLVSGIANVKMRFGDLPSNPVFSYTPATLSFANVISGASSDWQNVTVSNIGAGTLTLAASDVTIIGTDAAHFEYDPLNLPADIEGSPITIPVRFTAPGIGTYNATLRMTYESVDYDVILTGTGVAPYVNMSDGSTTLAEGEIWNFYDSGGVSGQYGSSENFTYTFNPPDGYRCSVQFSAFNTESDWDFLKIYDGTDTTGTLIGNYSGTAIPPDYTAINSGSLTFVFTSDGSGVRDGWAAAISAEALPQVPMFVHSPLSLLFPFTATGASSAAQDVTVSNIGVGTLELDASAIAITGTDAANFSVDTTNLPFAIGENLSDAFSVSFNPQSEGEKNATLVISYGSVDYEVALSGYAYPADYVFEGFEGTTFPPVGWANPGTWTQSTSTYFDGSRSAYKYGSSSSPYILSSPKLNLESGGYLSFMARISSTTAALDIVYSTDRATWTKLGDSILATASNAWFPVLVDLNTIPAKAGAYYIGFRAMSIYVSYYIDNVIMPPFAQEAPEAVTLTAPANSAANLGLLPTFSWTPATTGGVPTAYDIYLEATDSPVAPEADPLVLWAENVPASPYTATAALDYSTTYIWKVVAKNIHGDAPASAVRSFSTMADPTIYDLPWLEDFGTTTSFPPLNWTRLTGLYPTDTPAMTTSGWTYDDFCNVVTTPKNTSAKVNVYGSNCKQWLVTPPIAIPADGYELKFDLGLTDFASINPIEYPEGQADDRFIVIISDSPNMSSPTTLREWNNSGSEYVFNEISHTGEMVIINLDGYSGTKYIAFYGESTVSITGEDNDLFVDNVTVRETPTEPIFAIDPIEKNFGKVEVGSSSETTFTISNTGGVDLEIAESGISLSGTNPDQFGLGDITYPLIIAPGANATITVSFTPTTKGLKSATLEIVDNTPSGKSIRKGAKATQIVDLSGEGMIFNTVPYAYGFSEGWGDWTVVNGTQTNKWHVGDPGIFGTNAAYISNDGGVSFGYNTGSTSVVHFYQDINFPAETTDFKLKFDWLCNGEGGYTAYDFLRVYAVDTAVMPQAGTQLTSHLGTYYLNGATVQTASIDLPNAFAGTTKRIVFSWRNDSSGGSQPPAVVDNIRLVIGSNADTGEIDGGLVHIEPTVTPDGGSPINPNILIQGLVGSGTVSVVAGYADAGLPNAGLSLTLSGVSFSGSTITIVHDLGFAPTQIALKIVPGEWLLLSPASPEVTLWNATTVSFTMTTKADGDLIIVFPIAEGDTLPVTLSSFTAVLTADLHVNIAWTAESETNHAGYNILRSEVKELSTAIMINNGLIDEGTTNGTQIKYNYTDTEVYHQARYYYWLEDRSLTGESTYHGPLMVIIYAEGEEQEIPTIPMETKLFSAFPNPFNPSTNLRYSMKEAGDVRIEVYNVKGQILKTFENTHNQPGYYQVNWDGRDANGRLAGTGVYFYRMISGKYSSTKKMVLAK